MKCGCGRELPGKQRVCDACRLERRRLQSRQPKERRECIICGAEFWAAPGRNTVLCENPDCHLVRKRQLEREKYQVVHCTEVRHCAVCGAQFATRPGSLRATCGDEVCVALHLLRRKNAQGKRRAVAASRRRDRRAEVQIMPDPWAMLDIPDGATAAQMYI